MGRSRMSAVVQKSGALQDEITDVITQSGSRNVRWLLGRPCITYN